MDPGLKQYLDLRFGGIENQIAEMKADFIVSANEDASSRKELYMRVGGLQERVGIIEETRPTMVQLLVAVAAAVTLACTVTATIVSLI